MVLRPEWGVGGSIVVAVATERQVADAVTGRTVNGAVGASVGDVVGKMQTQCKRANPLQK